MKDRLLTQLMAMDRRALLGLLGVFLLFLALESWLLVLRAPLAEWRALTAQREADAGAVSPAPLQTEIDRSRKAIAQAEGVLQGAGLPHPDDEMVLHLIATLDGLAKRHGVSLGQVKAGGRRVERDVQIASFDAEARGSYLALIEWLGEAEAQIAPLRASDLQLSSSDEGRQVSLRVKFTAYLPIPDSPGAPR